MVWPANWDWVRKTDLRCLQLANRHYTRKSPGAAQYTRPGYNMPLWYYGSAVFNWFRPKWEAGIERMDGLRAYECTIFRNESSTLSSLLILDAEQCLPFWNRFDGSLMLITAVNSLKTSKRRSKNVRPGHCFLMAGWSYMDRPPTKNADVWLYKEMTK